MMTKWGTIMSKLRLTMSLMSVVGLILLVLAAKGDLRAAYDRHVAGDLRGLPRDATGSFPHVLRLDERILHSEGRLFLDRP
jgi:hypothetical protein